MMTLAPRGYGGIPLYQFSPPNQFNNRHYHGGHSRRSVTFAPHYPTKSFYQPPFNPVERSIAPPLNQFREPGVSTQLVSLFNQLDARYREEQYQRQLKKLEKQYWKMQGNNIPPPMYPPPMYPPTTMDFFPGAVYQYEKETKYVPFPVFVGTRGGLFGHGGAGSNLTLGLSGGMDLPPKVRVIFIPTGQSFAQQPCLGSLAMPPFLYNRISQPFSSFPLPPPLPQIGSLPLTPAVQQMVVQRYSNPIAVLSFPPSWQMPQMMMPSYSSVPQQYVPPVSAIPALPAPPQSYALPPVPQVYVPPPPQSYALPSAPQVYVPPPPPQSYAIPSAPQVYVPPLAPVPISSFPPAPQAYIPPPPPQLSIPISSLPPPQFYMPPPPPPSIPMSIQAPPPLTAIPQGFPIASAPPTSQFSLPDANVVPPSYSNYPSLCRACPPAPPPLNINITGHCWIQHCSACHHVATTVSAPNTRPNGGRVTPLLRQPVVPQYVPEQIDPQYYHANAPVMIRPWLRKTPPLPPGAVVISDQFIRKRGSRSRYGQSQKQNMYNARDTYDKNRSTTVSSKKTNGATGSGGMRNHRSMSPKRRSNNSKDSSFQQQGYIKTKNSIPLSSSNTSSSGLSGEYEKITFHPPDTQQTTVPQPLAREARNVNLQYKYQPEELPTVYLNNQYLKSSSEASTTPSSIATPLNHSPSLIKKLRSSPSSSSSSSSSSSKRSKSVQKDLRNEKENGLPPRSPSQSKTSKEKVIIIREFMASSPSTLSSISSDMTFSIIGKDDDALSTTSTIKAEQFEGDDTPLRHVF